MKLIAYLLVSISFLPLAAADVSLVDNHETVTVDCAADPNVLIAGNHATVTLTGTCKKVLISGNHATVTGSVTTVLVSGNHNTANLDAVDSLATSGNENTATWKTTVDAKKKKPRIGNTGHNNTITQTK